MWQSQVETEHYFVVCFDHITAFEAELIEIHNRIMFDSYPGLPHMASKAV